MNSLANPYLALVCIYVFVIGLCVGSFLNVVILRGIKNEDIVFKPSYCPKCGKKLKWYMNIPVISYIFLKGKCAFCASGISVQYPLVELVCALLFTLGYIKFGLNFNLLFVYAFIALSVVMAVTDIKITAIVDTHAYILTIIGLLYSSFAFSPITVLQSFAGGLIGYIAFEFLSFVSKKIIGYRMFGEGDSLIALALGAFLGFKAILAVIPLSFVIQFLIAVPFLLFQSYKNHNKALFISYIFIILGCATVIVTNLTNLIDINYKLYLIITIFASLLLVWSLVVLLKQIKSKSLENIANNTKDELLTSFCTLPFGPALLVSGILCLFCFDYLITLVKNFLTIV